MHRGVAQVVAHLTGGQGVASSSLVTPTKIQGIQKDTLYFALLRKGELATGYGELGVLPPRLDRETVRWTVSSILGYLFVPFTES